MDHLPCLDSIEELILLAEAGMSHLSGCKSGIDDQRLLVCYVVERERDKYPTLLLSPVVGKEAVIRFSTQERALYLA